MKRWVPVAMLVGVMLVASGAACEPPPPAGSWTPPKIISADLSADPVAAGTAFSLTVSASDNHQVDDISVKFYGPMVPAVWSLDVPCDRPAFDADALVTVQFACTMPAIAPDGAWTAVVAAGDGESIGPIGSCNCTIKEVPFAVTGGTDDLAPPVLESAVTTPDPVPVGAPFTVTIRSSDDHPGPYTEPLTMYYDVLAPSPKVCTQTSQTELSSTEYEWTFDCPAHAVAGDYLGSVQLRDQMNQRLDGRFEVHIS